MESGHKCQSCGGATYEAKVRMLLEEQSGLVIIEDIPAWLCDRCNEQFYDEVTRVRIEILRKSGFPFQEAKRVVEVPIFSMNDVPIPKSSLEDLPPESA